ncbi:unnamed protein product [Adineta ricciae]|nr:unnamed protein product [Adineta ricciae]
MLSTVFLRPFSSSMMNSSLSTPSTMRSKWKKNRLVVIPALWKEINWADRSSWPLWIRDGLDLFNPNPSRSYDIHLYQRIDPNSTVPYDWPYCQNVHEEAGVYLKFIYDYYYDLPDKMLFLHGNPHAHSPHPIEAAQCVRDDVYYANINTFWIQDRPWSIWSRDPKDNIGLMYKCAARLLTFFGFDAEAQLNPDKRTPKDNNLISTTCCAQFYVRKERIQHYTYEQWTALYRASLEPYCTTELDREQPGKGGTKWFGGSFEHLWHVILGLNPVNMLPRRAKTSTDICHLFRASCNGSLCKN